MGKNRILAIALLCVASAASAFADSTTSGVEGCSLGGATVVSCSDERGSCSDFAMNTAGADLSGLKQSCEIEGHGTFSNSACPTGSLLGSCKITAPVAGQSGAVFMRFYQGQRVTVDNVQMMCKTIGPNATFCAP